MLNFLSPKIKEKIFSHDFKNILEIRARENRKIVVTYYDKGILKKELDYVIGKNDIENIILKLSNYSYASIENNLKMGFISSSEGERIGVSGECVVKDGKIVSIKNFSSLCIRFPNVIEGCSKIFFETNVIDCPKIV